MARLALPTDPSVAQIEEVAGASGTDLATGLSSAEAASRLDEDGPNTLADTQRESELRRFLRQFADPLVYLLLMALGIAIVAWWAEGADEFPYDAVVIAVVVLANAIIGYVQERRSADAVAALKRMAASQATVLRDGTVAKVPAPDIVVGDVVLLAEGDAVVADARVVEAGFEVAEAALTGESAPVAKSAAPLYDETAIGDRSSMVFSGTAVTKGTGTAVVTGTGMDTETGRIAELLETTEDDETPLQREIGSIGRTLGFAVIVIAAVIVAVVLLTSGIGSLAHVAEVLLLGVAIAVAAVPEGLPAIMSLVLALGVQRMATRNAIVKDLSSVETLGSASVICSDKTGTLTQNSMTITRVCTASGEIDPRARDPLDTDDAVVAEARLVIGGGALANDAHLVDDEGRIRTEGDPTETAFLVAEHRIGLRTDRTERYTRVDTVPFDSSRKRMSVLARDERAGGHVLVSKGAPDVLLERCTRVQVGTEAVPMDDAHRRGILADVEQLSAEGMRTLAVAFREAHETEADDGVDSDSEHSFVFGGVVGIVDPPRKEAADAVAQAQAAGVRVVMITGDHPLTATSIATALGIVDEGARSLTGTEIAAMDEDALREVVPDVSVYARVAPEDKLRIVDALQSYGDTVAMTGDGVNDAPALRSADIGVAMGKSGTEVAREAANMILTDDNFATIVAAVREGRGIVDNIKRFLRYLLATNFGEVLAVFFAVVLSAYLGLVIDGAFVAPLLAVQILWINLLTDLAPALAMGVEPFADDLMTRRPRKPTERLIDRRMWGGIAMVGVVMAAATLLAFDVMLPGGLVEGTSDVDTARTVAFTTLVLANVLNAFNARSETQSQFHRLFHNPWLWGAVALSIGLQVAVVNVPLLQDAFGTVALTWTEWAIAAALALSVPLAGEVRSGVLRLIDARRERAQVSPAT